MAYPGLDPSLEPVVEEIRELMKVPPDEMGHVPYREMMAARSAALPKKRPESLQVSDHALDTPYGTVGIRAYRPEAADGGALVYMHGGGWIMGDLNSHDGVCVDLALQSGLTVFALDYGLAPENPYPVALNQCHWVFHHLRENAGKWQIDADRIAIGGDSAGGNLALAVCLKTRGEAGALPCAQLLIYPCVSPDLESPSYEKHANAPFLDKRGMVWIWNTYLAKSEDWQDPLALPALESCYAGLPPTVVFTAEIDPLASEGAALAQRFVAEDVPVFYFEAKGLIHGLLRFRERSPASARAFTRMVNGLTMLMGYSRP